MCNFGSKLVFEKIDNNSYIFTFTKKSKYKYIVPNRIKSQMDIITSIFEWSSFLLAIMLAKINLVFLLFLFFIIPVWMLLLKYLLRNCEKELIKKP